MAKMRRSVQKAMGNQRRASEQPNLRSSSKAGRKARKQAIEETLGDVPIR